MHSLSVSSITFPVPLMVEYTHNELCALVAANIPMVVLHGRRDLVASPECGRNIARKLGAKFVEIEGAHLINRECAYDVSWKREYIRHLHGYEFA